MRYYLCFYCLLYTSTYFDQEKNEHYIPYVIVPSLGVERSFLAFLCDAYDEEVLGQEDVYKRQVMSSMIASGSIRIPYFSLNSSTRRRASFF